MTSFHANTFRLLATEQCESIAATRQIDDTENRLGIRFPPSFREWYSHRDALQILASHSNQDPPIPVTEFAVEKWNTRVLVPFKIENQGVCVWSVLVDGSDDPPVYVNVDENGWQAQTDTFSAYVYSCVWDYAVLFAKPALVQAQNAPISNNAIQRLRTEFTEQLKTYGWPGNTQYRFSGDRQAILIWSGDYQADWFVAAADPIALRKTLVTIWHIDSVGDSLYDASETGLGKEVLSQFREKV